MEKFWMWLHFLDRADFYTEDGGLLEPMFYDTPDGSLDAPSSPKALPVLLMSTRAFNATNCWDRLYALVGISTDDGEVVPDYSKTAKTLFVDYIKFRIAKDQALRCLFGNGIASSIDNGPSWSLNSGVSWRGGLASGYDPEIIGTSFGHLDIPAHLYPLTGGQLVSQRRGSTQAS
ncbi:hypothetical protein DL766_006426 [Monosporascus sp. MC13-8B]|uniref:Uncharacterized protein n=1 Tax=Monosporascus cannonballus TaxID=155416 RepID=A0ABY0HGC6_9PEZI|nr:hypothetical protein DL762_002965 [Monosporascus cannonballus]RYO96616.1 hypothetical protein DL763_003102 [Monosporascus cannonballus]RYP27364.1 hypothetical protein DL766_006426 [Monosporascus sp. MC13-8B]